MNKVSYKNQLPVALHRHLQCLKGYNSVTSTLFCYEQFNVLKNDRNCKYICKK